MNNANLPINPLPNPDLVEVPKYQGLTKREYTAIELAKVFSPPKFCVGDDVTQKNIDQWGEKIVRLSDELLNKLDKDEQD